MKLSTKGRYGSRALLDLAGKYGKGPIMVKEIADRQDLSEKYLEQILSELRKAGIVISIQGKNGGFQLARPPEKITLLDIVKVLEGGLAPVKCVDDESLCKRSKHCVMRDVWESLRKSNVKILGNLTLKDLLEKEQEKITGKTVPDFSI
jgi:Rrf2 family protein